MGGRDRGSHCGLPDLLGSLAAWPMNINPPRTCRSMRLDQLEPAPPWLRLAESLAVRPVTHANTHGAIGAHKWPAPRPQ